MNLSSEDIKAGNYWLLGASIFLTFFVYFLIWTDNTLTNSDRELHLESTLKELRGAQSGIASGVDDARQVYSVPVRASEVNAALAENGEQVEHH